MERKAPSFAGLRPASEASSQAKRMNRRSNTQHELMLHKELRRMGLRFRKNVGTLPGKPDIVLTGSRVLVFCDGDFWHGRNWRALRTKLQQGANAAYWLAKIKSNIERDRRNTKLLEKSGWHVIRLWESEIKKNPTAAARRVRAFVKAHASRTKRRISDRDL